MPEYPKRVILRRLLGVMCLAAAALLLRFAFRWVGPFFLAWLTCAVGEKRTRRLVETYHWKRHAASAVVILVLLLLAGAGALGIVWGLWKGAEQVAQLLPGLVDGARQTAAILLEQSSRLPPQMESAVREAVTRAEETMSSLPSRAAQRLPEVVSAVVSAAPGVLLFLATYVAGALFLGMDFPAVRAFFRRQLPPEWAEKLSRIRRESLTALSSWLSAQVRLMTVTFLLMTVGLWLMHQEGAALIALGVAVVDALPVLGTGTVLIPWALWCAAIGRYGRGVTLGILYLVTVLVRSFLEPKLIGRDAGLPPAASLFGMYTGFCLCGVGGMILFPMGLMAAKQLRDAGEIRLWK